MDNIYSDLAVDYSDFKSKSSINVYRIDVDKKIGKTINKKKGLYVTITFKNIIKSYNKVLKLFEQELYNFINDIPNMSCLIIGLGNIKLSPDSLGPKTSSKVMIRKNVYIFNPDVEGNTGISSYEIIKKINTMIKPNFIIVIDGVITNSVDRLNKAIQITNAGITPGSGVGNYKNEISQKKLNIPVISIGIPTALYSSNDLITISKDIDYQIDLFSSLLSQGINDILKKLIN